MSLQPPGFIKPCLPTGSQMARTGPQWAYEIKHDGFRFICHRDAVPVWGLSRLEEKHML
jgi:ATP-dependent DNA ligase